MAESKDFDSAAPPKSVTDPEGDGPAEYPRHVFKYAAAPKAGEEPLGLVIAWNGRTPIYNEFQNVADEAAFTQAIADGWADAPVLKGKK